MDGREQVVLAWKVEKIYLHARSVELLLFFLKNLVVSRKFSTFAI